MASRLDNIKHRKFDTNTVKKTDEGKKEKIKDESNDMYDTISLELIDIDTNIRKEYNQEDIKELAESLKLYGQLEPVRVYDNKKTGKYTIIFGHRRYFAAKLAGLKELKCIISPKPDSLENILLQAVENEHAVNLSSTDREKYVKVLQDKYGLSLAEISFKLGKNEAWASSVLTASKSRKIHEPAFNNVGITMTTSDARLIANSSKEDVKEALGEILKNPGSKSSVLKDLNEKSKKKPGTKTKKPKNNNSNKSNFEPESEVETEKSRPPIVNFSNEKNNKNNENNSQSVSEPQEGPSFSDTDPLTAFVDQDDDTRKKFHIDILFDCDTITKQIKVLPRTSGDVFDHSFFDEVSNFVDKMLKNKEYIIEV